MTISSIASTIPEIQRHPSHGICVPLAQRVPLTDRTEALIDSPILQRLRGVRQLAFAHLVYPDATHTRFGHSLGVFCRTGKYVQSLLIRQQPSTFADMVGPKEIAALLVASLLHDAGHYPAAHSFEELIPRGSMGARDYFTHDRILVRLLRGQMPGIATSSVLDTLDGTLKAWGVTRYDVIAVLTGHRSSEQSALEPDVIPILHSIIDGPLDADKLDYVQRDSLHTGNPAGQAVDEERLIDSLVVHSADEGLGIGEQGLNAAQSLAVARAAMFMTVYWHRTNRCANRMFTEALRLYQNEDPKGFVNAFEADIFRLDDEALVRFVAARLPTEPRDLLLSPLQAIDGDRRHLYQRIATVSASPGSLDPADYPGLPADAHGRLCHMYDQFISGTEPWRWRSIIRTARSYISNLSKQDIHDFEVLLDVPDARFETPVHDDYRLGKRRSTFTVYDASGTPDDLLNKDPVFDALLQNWRVNARKIRLFVSPRVAAELATRGKEIGEFLRVLAHNVMQATTKAQLDGEEVMGSDISVVRDTTERDK